ncbi:iron complex transport system permease protein [Bacillus horti]|uniref:Iron complex transport system permease protein n=2 Tax=Caldalkalibacillus horti TaxID=77523 RepID=A0ABT9VVX3_9BACI|nr:iron complex transport system permease protein [Bacillus horti]
MKRYRTFRMKSLPISFLVDQRALIIIILLTVALVALMLISLGSGTTKASVGRVVATLLGSGTTSENFALLTLRLPRILLGALVGAGLALSGSILQGLIRNPLAAPDVIGVSSGASLMAVLFISVINPALGLGIDYLPLFAFLGALTVVYIMYGLAWKDGVSPFRLILIGFGITALLGAIQTILMIFGPITTTSQSFVWLTGSLHATKWHEVEIVSIWMLILTPILFGLVMALNLQQVSDEITVGLGGRLQLIRLGLVTMAACLAGVSIAFAGSIGFIGLMAPHIARKLVGTSYGQLMPTAALIGAILIVFADWVGRTWFAPLDIPAGVFTAMIGAPFFVYLFIRMRNK